MQVCRDCNQQLDDNWLFCHYDGEILKDPVVLGEKYRITEKLGRGGMGFVYKATHINLDNTVAVKIIKPEISHDREAQSRFRREARIMANLSHKNIVRVIDYDVDRSYAYIVMDFLDGEDLKQMLGKSKMLSLPEIASILSQVCDGIAYAHDKEVLHRDLKPSNIFLAGQNREIKIMDFGIAKILNPNSSVITGTKSIIGTPNYMSPEQLQADKNIDLRADIYSLGVILYEMICGKIPFVAKTAVELGVMHLNAKPKPLSENGRAVPLAVERVVQKALAKKKGERQQSAMELADEFNAAIREQDPILEETYEDSPPNDDGQTKSPGGGVTIIKNKFEGKVSVKGDFNA